MKHRIAHFSIAKNYGLIAITVAICWLVSLGAIHLLQSAFFLHSENLQMITVLLDIVTVLSLGFIAYELSKPTVIPSFVVAILFGFVSRNTLSYITLNTTALSILTTIGATLILFGGGLETPFTRFKSLVGPILSIAFLGTLLTAFSFSIFLGITSNFLHINIPVAAIILLGIALASTDPAAIIPSLKSLYFRQPKVKHIAISESALNDVIGALTTGIFLSLFMKDFTPNSILDAYKFLFTFDNLVEILKVIAIGTGVGIIGFIILHIWSRWKENIQSDGEADAALFLAVPISTYMAGSILGGNGFLAVFVTGLLFQLRSHVKHVENFFNHTIEGFMKPLIFMLLGTLVNFQDLQQFALLGISMALIFMFILRPLVVFITLSPFRKGENHLSFKELLFLSFVRETGVIPAVLLVTIKVANIPGSNIVLSVGMWVILLTLIIQPPLTPFFAKRLGIAEDLPPFPNHNQKGPVAVLCSRSYTFLQRLDNVVDWSQKHLIENILLLHCPEDKYSESFLKEVHKIADIKFKSINDKLSRENRKELNFRFLGRPGKLEENIESLVSGGNVSIIFVGSKMLDYRLDKVKHLQVPLIFVD